MTDGVDEPVNGPANEPMKEGDRREERAILEALAALEAGEPRTAGGERAGEAEDAVAAADVRTYTELLGVLPRGLEPVTPSPEGRERLMAAVRAHRAGAGPAGAGIAGAGTAGGAADSGAGADSSPGTGAGPLPFRRPEPEPLPGEVRSDRRGAPRWLLPLAAALAALAFGLAGWLGVRVAEQEATIAELTEELSAAGERAELLERANADLASGREELRHQLTLATSLGMVACPLKPMDDDFPEVRGLLVMSPDGGPWLVSVHDLEPPPEGASYVLWFLGRDRPRRVGVLAPGPDRAAQISAETMPGHEAMTGVAVTLERTPRPERPSGPMLLFGDDRISII